MTVDRPFDVGVQAERTLLAWRRTALALAVAGAVGARLTLPVLGGWAVGGGLLCVSAAVAAFLGATVRYRRNHRALISASAELPGGAVSALAVSVCAALVAGGGLAYVVLLDR